MCYDDGDSLLVGDGSLSFVVEQKCLTVGDETPMLHRSRHEVRYGYLIYNNRINTSSSSYIFSNDPLMLLYTIRGRTLINESISYF